MKSCFDMRLAFLFVYLCIWLNCVAAAQTPGNSAAGSRTLNIPELAGQPGYALRISVSGRQGLVEVRDSSGSLVQNLTCPLPQGELQGEADPSAIKSVAEEFVRHFETEDLNFDGYLDLKGVREFGAKWGRYCVWLFDPATRTFQRDELAAQMELLSNLSTDAKSGDIISYSIGPVNPWVDLYRIERAGKYRPYSRLIPVASCFLKTTSPRGLEDEPVEGTMVMTRYEHGQAVVVRRPLRSGLCDKYLGKHW